MTTPPPRIELPFTTTLDKLRHSRLDAEISRLFDLDHHALGEALLAHARASRARWPDSLRRDDCCYNAGFVWDLIPDVAFRLGATTLIAGERQDEFLGQACGIDYRHMVSSFLFHVSRRFAADLDADTPTPWDILTNPVQHGNPVAFGLDRLFPPDANADDAAARHIREAAHLRGHADTHAWTPDLLSSPSSKVA